MDEVIDAHIHTAFGSALLAESAAISGVNHSLTGLKREMAQNNVKCAVSMGLKSSTHTLGDQESESPMIDDVVDSNIVLVGGINPHKTELCNLSRAEKALADGRIRGLKIYLGYFHRYAYDDAYRKFYELAARYDVPVILHTGDTYDRTARLKFAHPLTVDEIAVDFRDTRFIIAHVGNPWTVDAGEVIYKNGNVYGDLSGLFLGDERLLQNVNDGDIEHIVKVYRWVADPTKFLYGSDWPVVPMGPYIKLIKRVLREACPASEYEHHLERVFSLNARHIFNLARTRVTEHDI